MTETGLKRAGILLLVGPGLLLGGALIFQYIGGFAPCELCLLQRWPHAAAIGIAALAPFAPPDTRRGMLGLAALAVLISAALGLYHVGIEQHWWQGPAICTAPRLGPGDFLTGMLATPVVLCDRIAWSLAGISMAGYNAILSASIAGAGLWLILKRS